MVRVSIWILFIIATTVLSCKSKKTSDQHVSLNLPPEISVYEAPVQVPDSVYLRFQLLEITPFADSIKFRIRYGGGCIKPHIFECYTSGEKSTDGVFDLFLSHKTLDDRCKALVFTERTYFWGHLFQPGDKIRVNGGEILTVPDKTNPVKP